MSHDREDDPGKTGFAAMPLLAAAPANSGARFRQRAIRRGDISVNESTEPLMSIVEVRLKNFRQFRDLRINFTSPSTGKPIRQVCFIGSNGTGKSTLLALLAEFLKTGNINVKRLRKKSKTRDDGEPETLIAIGTKVGSDVFYLVKGDTFGEYYFTEEATQHPFWEEMWRPEFSVRDNPGLVMPSISQYRVGGDFVKSILSLRANSSDVVIFAPPDLGNSESHTVSLSDALQLFNNFPAYHEISHEHSEAFWKVLLYQIKRRERDYQLFLSSPEAQLLLVGVARSVFEHNNPHILEHIALQWDLILKRAGLEFDIAHASIPVQLNERFEALIRRSMPPHSVIPYESLSSGIRHLILRLGYVYGLYFNRQIDRGFLLMDEPEISLFPDVLYDIMDRYKSVVVNTQIFIATHSPIIAAQFDPEERIILAFDDNGYVFPKGGVSPEGDDPNDLLTGDFGVRSLYGAEGIKQWNRYLDLRREIAATTDKARKAELLKEYSRIGNAYNFIPNNEVP